jgi:hypothetical protein
MIRIFPYTLTNFIYLKLLPIFFINFLIKRMCLKMCGSRICLRIESIAKPQHSILVQRRMLERAENSLFV